MALADKKVFVLFCFFSLGNTKYQHLQIYFLGLFNSLEGNPTNLCLWGLSLVVCVLGAKWGKETKESHDYHEDVYLIVQFPSWNMTSVLI